MHPLPFFSKRYGRHERALPIACLNRAISSSLLPAWAGICLFLALAGSEAAGQTILPGVTVSSMKTKDREPLVERESLKWADRPASDAAEYLHRKPEFSATRIGGTAGTIFLRGLGGPRLGIVMNDRLEAAAANHGTDPATSYIQPDSHDEVTIVKGPNSVLYGSSMGGMVIFKEKPGKFEKIDARARLSGGLGSFGRRDFTADATVGNPLAQLRGVVNFTRGDNYRDGSGREFFSFFDRRSGKLLATFTPTRDTSLELGAEQGDAQVAFPAFSLMGDGIRFKREILSARFTAADITEKFRKLEVQVFDRDLDHLMDNFTLRPATVQVFNPDPPGPLITNTSRRTVMQAYAGRSVRVAATFDATEKVEAIIGYEHKDEKFRGNNRTAGTFCIDAACATSNIFSPFYDLHTVNNSAFSEVTYFFNDRTTFKGGIRRDYFHTFSGELRDFLGTTIHPTSHGERNDIINSGFIRGEYEFMPGTTAFLALANGERPASNLERASFDGFDLKKEKNREINIGVTVDRPRWSASATVFGSRIDDYILISQGTRSQNVDVYRGGFELDAVRQITPFWRLFGNVAAMWAQNLTGHGSGPVPLAQTPPLDSRFGAIFQYRTFTATFAGRAVTRQSRIDPGFGNFLGIDNPDPTPGFATAYLSMSWKPVRFAQLSLGIDNLFDRTYYEHLSRRVGDVPPGFVNFGRLNEPGRAFWFRVVINTG